MLTFSCCSQFQVDAPILTQDLYNNPQFRDPVFKKNPAQTPPFYLNYSRPLSPPQVSPRPPGNWHMPPAVQHYEFFNHPSCVPVGGNVGITDLGTADPGSSPAQMATMHNALPWSSWATILDSLWSVRLCVNSFASNCFWFYSPWLPFCSNE